MSGADGGDAGGLTPFAKGGFDIASFTDGGVIALFDAVMNGKVDNGYALVRPPGHHALPDQGFGFCIFNNIARDKTYSRDSKCFQGSINRLGCAPW